MEKTESCDDCVRLRIKCHWKNTSFALRCDRCASYGLDCVFGGLSWTANSTAVFQSSAPDVTARSVYWSPSSNAGGHPLDLHSSRAPLATPENPPAKEKRPEPRQSNHSTVHRNTAAHVELNISPRVRDHLHQVFFNAIQPAWPVVTTRSLVHYPPSPLLEAAILGVAARHHTAIVSWRDFAHLKDVIESGLRALFSIRSTYEPTIQSLQALLLLSLRLELCSKNHGDIQRVSFRIGFACRMAQDLKCHLAVYDPSTTDHDDLSLHRALWAACIFLDTYMAAALGQVLRISIAHNEDFSLQRTVTGTMSDPKIALPDNCRFFYTAVGLMSCLRTVLHLEYSVQPAKASSVIYHEATDILHNLQWHQRYLENHESQFTHAEWKCLQMIHSNTHLLYIFGLRLSAVTASVDILFDELQTLIRSESLPVIVQACQTLDWSTPELIQSIPGQLLITLYSTTRALMIVVDVLRDTITCETAVSDSVLQALRGAVLNARAFMEFLQKDTQWGKYWTQAHTLQAVLARLDNDDGRRDTGPPSLLSVQEPSLSLNEPVSSDISNTQMRIDIWNGFGEEVDFSDVIFNPSVWDEFFEQYERGLYDPGTLQ